MLSGGNRIALGCRGRLRLVDPLGIIGDLGVIFRLGGLARDALGEGPAGCHRVDSATQTERVEGLHQPGLGIGTLGEIEIGDPVEEHDDPHVGERPGGLIEAERLHHSHRTHRTDLHVDDHHIR